MAVSKMAVIAIVAILAVPILVGYGMNLQQVTHSDYKESDDPVITTPLIQNDTAYTYAHSDPYQLNTTINVSGNNKMVPYYMKVGNIKTSYPTEQLSGTGTQTALSVDYLGNFKYYILTLNYDYTTQGVGATVYANDGNGEYVLLNIPGKLYCYNFQKDAKTFNYSFYTYTGGQWHLNSSTNDGHNITRIVYTPTNPLSYTYYVQRCGVNQVLTTYVDIASGFQFRNIILNESISTPIPNWVGIVALKTPADCRSALITIDLDSISVPNYNIAIGGIYLVKTTTGGVVSWTATDTLTSQSYDLYYNPSIPHNSYQLYIEIKDAIPNTTTYNGIKELRYVGNWPTAIGEANSYMTYNFDYVSGFGYIASIGMGTSSTQYSPTMRFDDAEFRAFEIPLIKDCTYDPASFRSNPITTLTEFNLYGNSITFGGNTYNVSDGNITLGTHKVSLNGIKFESILNDDLTYDNRINGTTISTTAAPSTITFNGDWSFNITTSSMESYSYTSTEWIAGSFGWDGIDSSFLFVALIADLGIFIALAIYSRNSNKSLWPALIVCGSAAFLIFCML